MSEYRILDIKLAANCYIYTNILCKTLILSTMKNVFDKNVVVVRRNNQRRSITTSYLFKIIESVNKVEDYLLLMQARGYARMELK